jgi:hypothetical protein
MATTGTLAGVALMKPGYDFAQKNSELQAVLGVAKDSAEMTALRKQPDCWATILPPLPMMRPVLRLSSRKRAAMRQHSGGDPVTLNMALANRRTMEENAGLLMGMKSLSSLLTIRSHTSVMSCR